MDYSKIYERLLSRHSLLPYLLGRGWSLPPMRVQLELTYRCNLRCPICYQDKVFKKGENELTTHEWFKVIDALPKFCLVTLFGGEPLVRRDFPPIAERVLASHSCNLVTNGAFLTPETNQFFVEKKLLLVGVSLDGVGEIHDAMRGVPGTYEKVIKNIADLQERKKRAGKKFPLLDIKTVVTKTNLGNLEALLAVVRNLEADFFTISLPKVSEYQFGPKLKRDPAEFPPLDSSLLDGIDFSSLKQILRKIISPPSSTQIRFYPRLRSIDAFDRDLYDQKRLTKNFYPCRHPWSGVLIGATGDVFPCLSLNIGNVREESLIKIWNGEGFRRLRKGLKKAGLMPACVGCCYLRQR